MPGPAGAKATLDLRPDVSVEVHVGHGLEGCGGGVEQLLALLPEQSYDLHGSKEIDRHPSRSSARAVVSPATASP